MPRLSQLKRQHIEPLSTVAKSCEIKPLGEISVPRKLRRKPVPLTSVVNDAKDAIQTFLDEMAPCVGDDLVPFKCWKSSYAAMRREHGWPPLSDRSLSEAMQVAGCLRREGFRIRGQKHVAFQIPQPMMEAA